MKGGASSSGAPPPSQLLSLPAPGCGPAGSGSRTTHSRPAPRCAPARRPCCQQEEQVGPALGGGHSAAQRAGSQQVPHLPRLTLDSSTSSTSCGKGHAVQSVALRRGGGASAGAAAPAPTGIAALAGQSCKRAAELLLYSALPLACSTKVSTSAKLASPNTAVTTANSCGANPAWSSGSCCLRERKEQNSMHTA